MKQGPSTMLMAFASHKTRIAIAASPAPRKMALIMNSIMIVTLPASMMVVNPQPWATTPGEAAPLMPIVSEPGGANQGDYRGHDQAQSHACMAACAAPSGFFPIRRATVAVAPILKPMAIAYIRVSMTR